MKIPIDIKSGAIATSEEQQKLILGIDLGTTNSLISYIKNGTPIAIRDEKNLHAIVPSVVHFDINDQPIVGLEALKMLESQPERTIYSVKRLMGKSYSDIENAGILPQYQIIESEDQNSLVRVKVGDKYYTPIDLSALILAELKQRAEDFLKQEVSAAVITVPAYFNDSQRQATRDAGKLAGLDVLRIVNEPTAASLGYGVGLNRDEAKVVAVYDLGGGTFDISILNLEDGIFEVLSTNGNTLLGGDDFDLAIVKYWTSTYGISSHSSKIRLAAEDAKKALSKSDKFTSTIEGKQVSITKSIFNDLILELVNQTVNSCKKALSDAKLKIEEIDTLVLVGGSTRVPLVKDTIETFFNKKAIEGVDPDEVVALGAAVQADILAGNRKDLLLLDITPLSLGIETVGGLMDIIVPRNSKVPIRAAKNYTTSIDGQTNLKINVFQGERELVEHNRKLGEFILKGIPPMAAAMPKIEISFILDADGILTVKARELRSDTKTQIEIKSAYGISEEEMGKMLLESIKNAKSDMELKNLQEAKNEANNILLASDKFINFHSKILTQPELKELRNLIGILKESVNNGTVDVIRKSIDELNTFSRPLAERAMDVTVSAALRGEKI